MLVSFQRTLNSLSGYQSMLSGCIVDPDLEKELVPPFKKLIFLWLDASDTTSQLIGKGMGLNPT